MGSNAQQFCLKWNNHQANMLSVFDRLLSNKSLVDVTIGCEGRQVKAHKVVLSACSPFFENLFTENPCKHPIVILKDIRYADLKALVEFMYKGEVNVVQEQLPTLLKTAEALKIKGLAEVTGEGKSDDKPHASVTPRPESPGSRRKRQRVRRKSTDSAAGVSESEESVPKAGRTEHDDSSMDGATSLDDGSQASLQHPQTPSQASGQARGEKETSNVQSNAVTVNNSSSSAQANSGNSTTNGPNSSSKDADFEPTRLLEASMTTDHGADNSTDLNNSTGPENPLLPDGLDIKPIITLEEGATPTGGIVPASGATSLATGTDAISSLFPYPQGTGAAALPGTSHQASPQSHVTATLAGGCSITGTLRGSGADASSLSSGDPCDALIRTVNDPSRPFECLVCGFRARFNSHMKVHTRIHTGYKPFACSVCDYRTTQKGNIKIHMTKKHGLPEDEVNLLLHGNISGAQLGGATIAIFQQLGQDSQNATSGNATSSHIHSSPSSFGATAVATSSASALASSSASLTVPSVPSAVSVLTCTGEILSSVRRVSTSLASASALGPSQQISTTPSPSVDARTYSVRSLAHADSASLQDPDDL